MDIKSYIEKKVKELLNANNDIIILNPPKEEMGDYSLQCASLRNDELKTPMDVANYLKDNFKDDKEYFTHIKVMGPYLNFYLDYDKFNNYVIKEVFDKKDGYGSLNQGCGEALLIEHTSINPNAEPHIGRCRNSLIGDFMSNLYKFTGYDVERHYFINDLGKKIALLVIGVEKYGLKKDDFSDILDVYVKISTLALEDESVDKLAFDYLEMVENGNEEMIKKFKDITDKCVEGQMKIFSYLGINFDIFTHESDYVYGNYLKCILDKLDKKGVLKEDELGRYYADLTGYDIPTKEPIVVLTRSNKTSLYPIKDLAYTMYKMDRNSKNNYIVLGEDHEAYFIGLSAILDLLGYKAPKLITYSYVLLDGDKMSTSGGTVVLVTDFIKAVEDTLINEFEKRNSMVSKSDLRSLVNACIKFTMLNVSKSKIVNFNLESATSFTGESGMYILYSVVRINSILRNNNIDYSIDLKYESALENKIIKEIYSFPELINDLLTSNEPVKLTKYIFNLTSLFSKYYESTNITNETDLIKKNSELRLLESIKCVLTNALKILGINTVDKM